MLETLEKLLPGDLAPGFALPTIGGEIIDIRSDHLAGKPSIVIFMSQGAGVADLALLAAKASEFAKFSVNIFVVLADRRDAQALPRGLVALLDSDGKVFQAFGISNRPQVFLIGPNRHIVATHFGLDCADAIAEQIKSLANRYLSARLTNHPPVLIVPDILSPTDCQALMNIYMMQGQIFVDPGHGQSPEVADYKMRIPEYGRKDRIDHWIKQPQTNKFLDQLLMRRLFPEINKAFQYRITRREDYRIGCYEGERGGSLHGHRDNSSPRVAHRRFACSINLNTEDFDGGEIRFPEYGNHLYRPPSGSAIVFSSSLLHEVLHVVSGRRFVLLAFLYGDH